MKDNMANNPASRDLEFEKWSKDHQKSGEPLGGAIDRIFKIPSQSPFLWPWKAVLAPKFMLRVCQTPSSLKQDQPEFSLNPDTVPFCLPA